MDRFDALQAFARVVETGSFTRAAQTLHLGRASVSQLVQQLEARLRGRLLHRTTRRVQVTPEGQAYYERVVRLLADLHAADAAIAGAAVQPAGRLRVDVPGPLARHVLVPALPELLDAFPALHIEMGVSDRAVDLLAAGVDCVVRGGAIANPALVARRVGELPLGVFAAPAYLARVGLPEHPAALADSGHAMVALAWAPGGAPLLPVLERAGERVAVRLPHRLVLDDACASLAAGVAGLGLVWLPHFLAAEIRWRGARWCRSSRTGASPPCRCMPPTRRTATPARGCRCSSTGWRGCWRAPRWHRSRWRYRRNSCQPLVFKGWRRFPP